MLVVAGRASKKSWVNLVDDYLWHPRVLNRQAETLKVKIFFTSSSVPFNAVDCHQCLLLCARK